MSCVRIVARFSCVQACDKLIEIAQVMRAYTRHLTRLLLRTATSRSSITFPFNTNEIENKINCLFCLVSTAINASHLIQFHRDPTCAISFCPRLQLRLQCNALHISVSPHARKHSRLSLLLVCAPLCSQYVYAVSAHKF